MDRAKDNNLVGGHVSANLAFLADGQTVLLEFNCPIHLSIDSQIFAAENLPFDRYTLADDGRSTFLQWKSWGGE